MKQKSIKFLSAFLSFLMVFSVFASIPFTASAAEASLPNGMTKVSDVEQTLAPGITQNEVVFYDENNKKQRMFLLTADLSVDTVSVESSYYNDQGEVWGLQKLTDQVAAAEANHAGENYKVVAGINGSFFNTSTGQPGGAFAINGKVCCSDAAGNAQPFFAILNDGTAIIEKAGQWSNYKDRVVEACQGYQIIVWEGKNQLTYDPNSTAQDQKVYPRTCIGLTADGNVVAIQVDASYGNYGLSLYHAAQLMIEAGCVSAVRLDEGGSSTYAAREEGSDSFVVLNNPVDGAERTIANGIIFVSTAVPSGVFDHAIIESAYDYYAPYTSATFAATGVDATNGEADLPAEAVWTLADDSFGTVDANGVFTSNGKCGNVTVNLMYEGANVGSKTITVVNPDKVAFSTDSTVMPYGASIELSIGATCGYYNVFIDASCFDFASSVADAGVIEGLKFTATGKAASTVISAKYKYGTLEDAKIKITFGKGSDILYDFEDGDVSNWMGDDAWNSISNQYSGTAPSTSWCDPIEGNLHSSTFLATSENGYVKNGDYALGFTLDATQNTSSGSWGYTHLINLDILDTDLLLRDVANGNTGCRIGMWMYIPQNAVYVCPRILWSYSQDGGQTWSRQHSKIMMDYQEVAYDGMTEARIPESGWRYIYVDISSKDLVAFMNPDSTNANSTQTGNMYPAFIEFIVHSNNKFNEEVTFFIDDITLDYGSVVSDRDMPIIDDLKVNFGTIDVAVLNGNTITANNAMFSATIADDTTSSGINNATGLDYTTAQIYVDGNPIPTKASGNLMVSEEVILTNGTHDITFAIADKEGNLQKKTKSVIVAAADSQYPTITVVGHSSDGSTPKNGSIYWLDFVASDVEKINKIGATIYLNGVNDFEYNNIVTLDGFTVKAELVDAKHLLTLTIEKTGNVSESGSAVVASIPVRVWTNKVAISANNNPVINIVYDVMVGSIDYTSDVTVEENAVASFGTPKTSVATTIQGANSASTYHTHSVAKVDDLAATCTTDGFKDRTYCEACKSVVEWGTILSATDHEYEIVDGVLKCVHDGCEKTFTGVWEDGNEYIDGVLVNDGWNGDCYYRDGKKLTGIQVVDGYYYNFGDDGICKGRTKYSGLFKDETVEAYRYAIAGELQGGWVLIGDYWHYFDTETKVAVTGDYYYASRGITYHFDETGRTEGVWQITTNGTRFWFGQWYYQARNANQRYFVEVDGKTYNFDTEGYVTPGVHALYDDWAAMMRGEMNVWRFDENGALICQITEKGVIDGHDGVKYLVEEDGYVHGGNAGLASYDDAIYFVNHSGKLALDVNKEVTSDNSRDLLVAGTYYFGTDGKLFTGVKTGADGVLYYYNNGKLGNGIYNSELTEINGDIYLVKWSGKVAVNETRDVIAAKSNGFSSGLYVFDETGRGEYVPGFTGVKAGTDGILYYYKDGKLGNGIYNNELAEINGEIYLVKWSGKVAADEKRVIPADRTNGVLVAGTYYFGTDGKLFTGVKKEADGILYYYKDGKLGNGIYNSELAEINGEIYLVKWSGKVAANEERVIPANKANGLLEAGTYYFGEDGKLQA